MVAPSLVSAMEAVKRDPTTRQSGGFSGCSWLGPYAKITPSSHQISETLPQSRFRRYSPTHWLTHRIVAALPLALVLALVYGSLTVYANGRATLVTSAESGPYQVDVSILPAQALVNNTHVSILLRNLADDAIITRADVRISGAAPELGTDFGPMPAPNDLVPQFFEASLPFDVEGEWLVTFDINSDLGETSLQVPMMVRQGGASVNWILLAAIVVAILASGIWIWDRIAGRRSGKGDAQAG